MKIRWIIRCHYTTERRGYRVAGFITDPYAAARRRVITHVWPTDHPLPRGGAFSQFKTREEAELATHEISGMDTYVVPRRVP